MTKNQFLAELAGESFVWRLDEHGNIRTADKNNFDPLTALCWAKTRVQFLNGQFVESGAKLGMSRSLAADIHLASDNYSYADSDLRDQVISILGVAKPVVRQAKAPVVAKTSLVTKE